MVVFSSSIKKFYEDLTIALQGISLDMRKNKSFNSKDVAKVMRYAQRCNTDGELGRQSAPNVKNVCAKVKKYGSDIFEVSSKRVVELKNKETGVVFVYEIGEDLENES